MLSNNTQYSQKNTSIAQKSKRLKNDIKQPLQTQLYFFSLDQAQRVIDLGWLININEFYNFSLQMAKHQRQEGSYSQNKIQMIMHQMIQIKLLNWGHLMKYHFSTEPLILQKENVQGIVRGL
ncbi:unnamed protein product [Paramecium octaurelia]|uniref:Uncharacterized protein n=1 Tax=Paramecium octaurelia TaxID=43137 RepID=A0A8S1YL07_PAROT|nr:unnamed protein product [Paramecium octaurelia]